MVHAMCICALASGTEIVRGHKGWGWDFRWVIAVEIRGFGVDGSDGGGVVIEI
jgi:hypothetical protein